MNKAEIKQRCKELARDSARKEGLVKRTMVMELLPDMLDSIAIDKDFILRAIKEEFDKPTANPVNIFLDLFGLRIIRTKKTIQNIDGGLDVISSYSIEDNGSADPSSLLLLNEKLFSSFSDAVAKKLSEQEKDMEETENFLKNQNATLHAQLENSMAACSQVSSDFDGNIKSAADRIQYMLCLIGKDDSSNIFKQLNELLEDLELCSVWSSDDDMASEGALFTVLKCPDPENRKEKPCILRGERIISKGVIFVPEGSENIT